MNKKLKTIYDNMGAVLVTQFVGPSWLKVEVDERRCIRLMQNAREGHQLFGIVLSKSGVQELRIELEKWLKQITQDAPL